MNSHKLYFKVTNGKENHNGFQYNDGLNILKGKFNGDPKASCVAGGLYFTDIKHIFEFLEYGIYLREVMLPTDDPDFKIVRDENNKWRANKIILGKRYNLNDVSTFEFLISNGHFEVVKYLVSKGANIHAENDCAIRWASQNGYLEVVQFLISKGADVHAENDYAIKWASGNGHLFSIIANYLFDLFKLNR